MNLIFRVGQWVEKHFPEKMTTEEVRIFLEANDAHLELHDKSIEELHTKISSLLLLHEDMKRVKEEINILKTQSIIKSKVAGSSPSNMTPFATRLPPVHPKGGNESLR